MDKTSTYKNEMGACHSMPLDFETKYVGPSSCRLPKLSSSVLDPMKKVYHSEEIYAQVFARRKWEHAWHTMGCKQGPQPTNQPTKHRLTLMILKPLMWKLFFNHKKMQDKGTIQLADPEKQYSCVF